MATQSSAAARHCTPCRGGFPPMTPEDATARLGEIPSWSLGSDARHIERRYAFKAFADALAFVNRVSAVAETERHHPDISFGWGYALIILQTHAIEGLHDNDFILAAKIDALD